MTGNKSTKTAEKTRKMVYIAVFVALIAVLSQISIPLPSGVPVTLQTFAIAFAGFFLGWKYALAAMAVYVALGAAGVPVFAGFTGGAYKLVNVTGGFIWGFFALAVMSGLRDGERSKILSAVYALFGLVLCHLAGTAQYAALTGNSFGASAIVVSVPYIAKDVLSVLLAGMVARAVSHRIRFPFREETSCVRIPNQLKNLS